MPTCKFSELLQTMPPERLQNLEKRFEESLASMPLDELRKVRAMTQIQLSEVSKIEHRSDICVNTLVDYVEALGGHLDIPESIANNIRLPIAGAEPHLRVELALALYAQGILSFGKAAELAELTRFAFADLTGERNIPRHYTEQDLAQDLDFARGQ